MKRQNAATLLSVLLVALSVVTSAHADQQPSIFCAQFDSAEDFARNAIAVCLRDLPSRRAQCMRDAEQQFGQCGFEGNFRRISNRTQSKIILLSFFKNLVAPKDAEVGLARR